MCRPNLERSVAAVVISLLVAGLLLVGTAQASAQSKSNGQGIPQQISALEQQIAAINSQLKALGGQLSGVTPGGGAGKVLRVVDANGVEVGPMIMPSYVVRKAGDSWLVLNVRPEGFAQFATDIAADRCGGKLYMQGDGELLKWAVVAGGIAYYASGPPQDVAVGAWQRVFAGGGSSCEPVTGDPTIMPGLSEAATADLRMFVPPFTVRYDQ